MRLTFPSSPNILFSKFPLKLIEKVLFYSIKQEGLTMLSTRKRILTRIRRRGPGGLWCADDFLSTFQRHEIDESLVRLKDEGIIRRVIPGIYEYPRFSELLQCRVATDIGELARTLARKFRWQICPDGETALNHLGLSTQIPGRTLYFSDGPNRKYEVEGQTLEFRHSTKRWLTFRKAESLIVVQGLMALGQSQLTTGHLHLLCNRFTIETWERILADISAAPIWIVETVRGICRKGRDDGKAC